MLKFLETRKGDLRGDIHRFVCTICGEVTNSFEKNVPSRCAYCRNKDTNKN